MRLTTIFCAALLLALPMLTPADAQAVRKLATESGLFDIGTAEEFEVLTLAGAPKSRYYCAAGQFAWLKLGARNTDDLVVMSGQVSSRYRDRRYAVVFGLASGQRQGLLTLHMGSPRGGQVMSVGHARSQCLVHRPRGGGHRHKF